MVMIMMHVMRMTGDGDDHDAEHGKDDRDEYD